MTYTFCFFGADLRALDPPSKDPSALFVPAFAAVAFFLGTSVVLGAGVALLSEASPLGEDVIRGAVAEALMGVERLDGVDFVLEFFLVVGFGRN